MPNVVKIGRYRVTDKKDANYVEIDGIRIAGLKDVDVVENGAQSFVTITFTPESLTIDNTLPPLTPPEPEPETEPEPTP